MRTRISYSTLPEHVRDYARWPTIDLTQLGDEDQARAERLSFGIKHYLDTGELNSACKLAACSKSTFYAQLSRCVQPDPTGVSVIGWMALIPHRRISDYRRKAEAPSRNGKGFAGAFQQFLESHPAILNKLISLVRNGGGGRSASKARRR